MQSKWFWFCAGLVAVTSAEAQTPKSATVKPATSIATSRSAPPSDSAIAAVLKAKSLATANWITPAQLTGDFDGDGKQDVALLVSSTKTKKRGVLIVHGGRTAAALAGAGVDFGNGGDDFEWADQWSINKRRGKPDAVLVARSESGGGLIEFVAGRYRWRQHGD